jgi:hypothetical protein
LVTAWNMPITPSGRRESNPRHPPWQGGALPAELRPHVFAGRSLDLPVWNSITARFRCSHRPRPYGTRRSRGAFAPRRRSARRNPSVFLTGKDCTGPVSGSPNPRPAVRRDGRIGPGAGCGLWFSSSERDWRSGSALRSHRRGHWFDPSIAHEHRRGPRLNPAGALVVVLPRRDCTHRSGPGGAPPERSRGVGAGRVPPHRRWPRRTRAAGPPTAWSQTVETSPRMPSRARAVSRETAR